MTNKKAFTLAEVLITLGIIGVVAALTIPAIMNKTNDKELVSAYLKKHNVLNNAYKNAESIKGYKLYRLAPQEFKKHFEEHLKLSGKSNCAHDVCLVDGSYFDYECDGEKCNYITVDVNGKKKPNTPGKDIYKFAITIKGLLSEGEDEICSGYDCGNYVLSHHKIFDGLLANCEEYGENGRCSLCNDGYTVNNGLCSAVNMTGCKTYDREICSECGNKYRNNDGICEEVIIENCKSDGYTGDKCTVCEDGFYAREAGYCETQPTYCVSMKDDGILCKLNNGSEAEFISSLNNYAWNSTQTENFSNATNICSAQGMRLPTNAELSSIMDELDLSGNYCSSENNCRYASGSKTVANDWCVYNGDLFACSLNPNYCLAFPACRHTETVYSNTSNVLCVGELQE